MRKRKRPLENRQLRALAYNDAVRDILHADGVFKLGDQQSRDAIWEWNGNAWRRVPLETKAILPVGDDEAVASIL